MKITFISLFPEYYKGFIKHSIIKNAISKKIIEIEIINPRKFSQNNKVDDALYGGGSGMLLMIEPIVKAIRSVKNSDSYIVLVGPRGSKLKQDKVKSIAKNVKHLILICGHYEGIDSRIKYYIDEEISIGDYIITGGETASMVITEAIVRLIPNVIKNDSHMDESFENNGLLEYDQFTKPVEFEGHHVPQVLLSGNHYDIKKFRRQNSIDKTIEVLLRKERNNGN
ncbi:MAG: tRNA (guanine-N(1)-)-methyltransferase [Candidatus Tyloplasma litorale]|nr:MAG: tRNA (guanine-N(1)-)-methyltransferase [Mycoplasmatales bacterium]